MISKQEEREAVEDRRRAAAIREEREVQERQRAYDQVERGFADKCPRCGHETPRSLSPAALMWEVD